MHYLWRGGTPTIIVISCVSCCPTFWRMLESNCSMYVNKKLNLQVNHLRPIFKMRSSVELRNNTEQLSCKVAAGECLCLREVL